MGIDYLNEKHLWNCGDGSDVRRSDDGGRIWTTVSNAIVGNFIRFINDQTGWIANQTQLVATNDGGRTWNKLKPPAKTIAAISPLSKTEGYILDSDTLLYFTEDAGQTWSAQKLIPMKL